MTDPASRSVPSPPLGVRRGLLCRCPACGEGALFGRFLKVEPECSACGQELHHQRADDFPPYIVMFIVGHLVGYGIYAAEMHIPDVPLLWHALLWPSLAIGLSLALLQPVKGAVIGLQWGLGMHGFAQKTGGGAGERGTWREAEAVVPGRGSRAEVA